MEYNIDNIYSVSQISSYLEALFNTDKVLQDLWVKGEVSNFYQANSGHMYFTIKDEDAQLKTVMFRYKSKNINFELEDGMEIAVHGYINVYKVRGEYQLYADKIVPEGKGTLYEAFEKLKKQLKEEGLFKEEHKSSIPTIPKKIGIVTSPTGAAIRDMLSVVDRRFKNVSILIVPSLVQGDKAADQLVEGINYLNSRDDIDLIIVSRGGGSIEDLWPFNEEKVARAIFSSNIPVISGVGHETDFTIADFVADLRAPTPSAAAELAIGNREEIENHLDNLTRRLLHNQKARLKSAKDSLNSIANRRIFKKPEELFINKMQRLDELSRELKWNMEKKLSKSKERFIILNSKMDTLSPLKTIKRGYSITYDQEDNPVTDIKQVKKGDKVKTTIINGSFLSSVEQIEKDGGLDE
ncbi:MAG TPA: exodeoxyribonuclease VII large subunit [Halanaerobiales bacterium]|nr:exodeoxyribonuclease VII large subunit [Halanaerobiales bacterium]